MDPLLQALLSPRLGTLGTRWDVLQGILSGSMPLTGTYSIDMDNKRFPSMVPGNTQWLTPLIRMGVHPILSDEQAQRALSYAQASGNFKPASSPMSPLGSEFDFYNPSAARLDDLRALRLLDVLRQ